MFVQHRLFFPKKPAADAGGMHDLNFGLYFSLDIQTALQKGGGLWPSAFFLYYAALEPK